MVDINKIIQDVSNENPYKQAGNRDSYSSYNEGWSDACDVIDSRIEKEIGNENKSFNVIEFIREEIGFRLMMLAFAILPHCHLKWHYAKFLEVYLTERIGKDKSIEQ